MPDKMTKETLEALKGSIAHWEKNVELASKVSTARLLSLGPSSCDLCQKFATGPSHRCRGCPVATAAGVKGCDNTPYNDVIDYDRHFFEVTYDKDCYETRRNVQRKLHAACKRELKFLKSLLPAGE